LKYITYHTTLFCFASTEDDFSFRVRHLVYLLGSFHGTHYVSAFLGLEWLHSFGNTSNICFSSTVNYFSNRRGAILRASPFYGRPRLRYFTGVAACFFGNDYCQASITVASREMCHICSPAYRSLIKASWIRVTISPSKTPWKPEKAWTRSAHYTAGTKHT